MKERPQRARVHALFRAKGALPLVQRQVARAVDVGARKRGRGVLREERLEDGDGRRAAPRGGGRAVLSHTSPVTHKS